MEIYIFFTHQDWEAESPNETLEGEVRVNRNTVVIETFEGGKMYKQILSPDKVFAITYKQPYRYYSFEKDIFLYLTQEAWSASSPEYSLRGELASDEYINGFISINTNDGYKQFISQQKLFSCVYEG